LNEVFEMNKSELIAQVAQKTGQPLTSVTAVVHAAFESISDTVAAGGTATFAGFGTFSRSPRAARMGRNPKTREPMHLAATAVPKFSAGTVFRAKVKAAA
jgi:DNA-binding protein HU-beta